MEMPKITEHHLRLKELVGEWRGTEIMHPSPWDPKGGKATGRTNSRLALNGFAMISDYEQERDGAITFIGHGVMTYDTKEACYVLHWFDGLGSPPEVFKGVFDGDILTVAHGGPGMHVRLTYDRSQKKRLISRMDMSQDGKQWKTLYDGSYENSL
jgi:uncharacterized protein YodC (DUF2158 family)